MATEDIDGWQVTIDPWYPHANSSRRLEKTLVAIEGDRLEVAVESGAGHDVVDVEARVPLSVVFRLLRQAGYRVERDESGVVRPDDT